MEDLEGLTGLKRTKGGSNDTEPAYIIERKYCGRWVACVALSLLVLMGLVWRNDKMLRRLAPRLAARRAEYRSKQHSAHARFTKLGQELESHLELDIHERETALKLRARLRTLEKTHRANVTQALEAASLASAISFEARDAVRPFVEQAVDALFEELRHVVEGRILTPMMASGNAAYERHKELHDEVLDELKRDREEREKFLQKKRNAPGDLDGDGHVEYGYGAEDGPWYDEGSPEHRDEEWRQDVLENFFESFQRHFNDTELRDEGLQPRSLLDVDDKLYETLVDMRQGLGVSDFYDPDNNSSAPSLTWQQAEAKLAVLKPELDKKRCHEFTPSDPPSDDEFDYMQLHNVERYLDDMIWHAKLNDQRDHISSYVESYRNKKRSAMELLEELERLEGDQVFPSYWLFHAGGSYDDFRYGDW